MGLGANIWSAAGRGEGGRFGEGEAGAGAEKLFWDFLAAWGSAGPLSSQKSRDRAGVRWGGDTDPGEAEGIPAEPTEDGDPQKQRGGYLMRAGDADPGEM